MKPAPRKRKSIKTIVISSSGSEQESHSESEQESFSESESYSDWEDSAKFSESEDSTSRCFVSVLSSFPDSPIHVSFLDQSFIVLFWFQR